ncbi:phosphoglycerate mutase family protein [Larkinella knui]|uniref:Phosphoglycerate mutase n=1 Tax=Larkinella knui TaxID=2025310 RepID=A0A3P1CC67_9BACT|nr:phosphoglycerate mutase family protein [Larkinella knui]RRB10676.1 phosphoglycerate mutase [Larkinella knui]
MKICKLLPVLFLLIGLTACSTSTVYVVRHAEKINETDSSGLTVAGLERSLALANRLADEEISVILTTPYRRTQQTAGPLAQQLNLPIESYPAKPVSAVVEQLEKAKGKNVLVVGHSNTILEIVRGLGAKPTKETIAPGDYDNLLIVTIKNGLFGQSVELKEETYGKPTAP